MTMPDALQRIMEAHGGLDVWLSLKSLEVRMSASGLLFTTKRIPPQHHIRPTVSINQPEQEKHRNFAYHPGLKFPAQRP
jgi:hypothetical protein